MIHSFHSKTTTASLPPSATAVETDKTMGTIIIINLRIKKLIYLALQVALVAIWCGLVRFQKLGSK